VGGALVRLGHTLARVKIWWRSTPYGSKYGLPKMHLGWVQFHNEISKITAPNFTGLISPNAGGIAVDRVTHRFWISLFLPETFAAELWNRPKSG